MAIVLQSVAAMLIARPGHVFVMSILLGGAVTGCVETVDEKPIAAPDVDAIAGCAPTTPAADARLTGVWIAPGGAVWAVGDGGLVGRRTNDRWTWCDAAGGVDLSAVWGVDDDDVWITGAAGTVLRWRGDAFDAIDVDATADLTGIWGASPTHVFVVGDGGVVRYHDGVGWRTVDVPADELGAVWGASAFDVWIGGRRRTTTTTPTGAEHAKCEATIDRWNATTRTFVREHAFVQEHGACGIFGLGGSGPADVWAVGTEFPAGSAAPFAFAAHHDGTQWSRATPPDEELTIDRTFLDVAAHAPGAEDGAWVVGQGTSAVRRNAGAWSSADDTTADLADIDARGGSMFAVGAEVKILRWSGTDWVRE
ncbi:MAG: hypothetical protein F9K40_09085 [Kofleriaceae bacterium]|nr:MAG: hypothetical protein F9K40_09085 [Kofleriaceae bacterium]MBZ0238138.1 hypothetical protein [Kofleriaceae bacterium]